MRTRTKVIATGVAAAAALAIAAGASVAGGSGDDPPLAGTDLERATSAALEHVGGGTVVEASLGDGGAAYEVEVRRADGSQVEVQLDARFHVTGSEGDDDGSGDATEGSESGEAEAAGG